MLKMKKFMAMSMISVTMCAAVLLPDAELVKVVRRQIKHPICRKVFPWFWEDMPIFRRFH